MQNCVSSVLFLKFHPEFFLLEINIWSINIPKTSILQTSDLYLQIKQERAFQPLQLPISHNRESTQALHFLLYQEMGGASCIPTVHLCTNTTSERRIKTRAKTFKKESDVGVLLTGKQNTETIELHVGMILTSTCLQSTETRCM